MCEIDHSHEQQHTMDLVHTHNKSVSQLKQLKEISARQVTCERTTPPLHVFGSTMAKLRVNKAMKSVVLFYMQFVDYKINESRACFEIGKLCSQACQVKVARKYELFSSDKVGGC